MTDNLTAVGALLLVALVAAGLLWIGGRLAHRRALERISRGEDENEAIERMEKRREELSRQTGCLHIIMRLFGFFR